MLCVCREQYGIPVLVKLLEAMPFDAVTAAAADALRALAMNNEANKASIRECWAVPLLVKLLGPEVWPNDMAGCLVALQQSYLSAQMAGFCMTPLTLFSLSFSFRFICFAHPTSNPMVNPPVNPHSHTHPQICPTP